MVKSLFDLSWKVTEEEYRADEGISYSTISFFEREGFRKIPELSKDIDTQSIRYGSLVDCLLTENEQLDEKFCILDTPRPSDAISRMIKDIIESSGGEYPSLNKVPAKTILEALNKEGYYVNYGEAKRMELLYKNGSEFYTFLHLSQGKTVVGKDDYELAKRNASTLRTHPDTARYFIKNPFKDTEHLFQLKFKIPYNGRFLRCMMDLALVDHERMVITPCDLKTTGFDEDKFESSFLKWGYIIQAQLYTHILKETIKSDEYFKNFTIEPYKFIVINKFNNTPIIWVFEGNHHDGDYIFQNQVIRGWKSIYEDLVYHLDSNNFKYPREAIENNGEMTIRGIEAIKSSRPD